MKLAVIGSRSFNDFWLICDELSKYTNVETIISGGAIGADKLAEIYAKQNGISIKIYNPNWQEYGISAGIIRNELIIKNSDSVIAFWDGKSKGTKSSIEFANKYNKPIKIVYYNNN